MKGLVIELWAGDGELAGDWQEQEAPVLQARGEGLFWNLARAVALRQKCSSPWQATHVQTAWGQPPKPHGLRADRGHWGALITRRQTFITQP